MRFHPRRSAGFFVLAFQLSSFHAAHAQTLQEAWVLAYQNNPSLEAQRAKLRAIDEGVSQAVSHWRPSVDATGNVGKTYQDAPEVGIKDFSATTRGFGVQVTQPVFRGFRTISETDAAKKTVLSGRADLESAEEQLFTDVGSAFLDLVRDEEILRLNHGFETTLQGWLKETRVRERLGDLTQTDIRQAQSRLARAHVTSLQTENALEADHAAFRRLTGADAASPQKAVFTAALPATLENLLASSEGANPKIASAEYAVEAADATVDLNKGSLLPEVNLQGSASRNWDQGFDEPGRVDTGQILVQATMPLYRAGSDYSKVREAKETATQKRMERNDTRQSVLQEARNAWEVLHTADAAIAADRTEIEAAAAALTGVKVDSRIGTRTSLDVLNAEQELLDARTDMARAEHDRTLASLQMASAMGRLTADALKLPVQLYDPSRHYDEVRGHWIGFDGGADSEAAALKADQPERRP